ncbi:MAG: hypothetical protein WCL21_06640 [Mariniphaga sp.]
MKAMKWLRSCGVRNINVLIDGHYYSELMKQSTGEEMQLTPGYSLYPVFEKAIFHPKIWMLFGVNEGLLIVGSGNLTSSGNGNNDEIWGAFHFDIHSIENASIFSAAWNYISVLCSVVKGQMNEKTTRWIIEHSKWLTELPVEKPFSFSDTSQKEKVAFLFNSVTSSIWEELTKHIKNENVIEITTISPYYDVTGKALQELKSLFPDAQLNVVLDQNGLIPSSLPDHEGYTFFDWYDAGVSKTQYLRSDFNKSKLHGKIIHFRTNSRKEYCLFGSANVTHKGLGLSGRNNSNAEVSLLIQSEEGGLLNELGIVLKSDNAKDLADFTPTTSLPIYQTVITNNRFTIQLLSAELIYDELTLYSSGSYSGQFKVVFFDLHNNLAYTQHISEYIQELKMKLNPDFTGIQYVQISDSSDKLISNKLLVSDYFLLAKTHPNPKTEEFESIYNEIHNGELSKVLDLLNYAILDETENTEGASAFQNNRATDDKRDEKLVPDKLYDLSTYKPIEHSAVEKNLMISSLSLRVLDVLKLFRSKKHSPNRQKDIRDDEQQNDLGIISGNEENEVKIERNLTLSLLKSDRTKLLNYFKKLYNYQHGILYGSKRITCFKPSLTDIAKYLIATELIFEYGGKTEKYDDRGYQDFFNYFPFSNSNKYDNDNVKGSCLNIIGDFLMLARTGFKKYEFDYTNSKIEQLKHDALINTIVCMLNNHWKENELPYFHTMLLNTLHYLGFKENAGSAENFNQLKCNIDKKISELKHKVNGIDENIVRFYEKICPAFHQVVYKIALKEFDTSAFKGQIIYKSPWGYCFVHSVFRSNKFALIRPGFIWDEDKKDYLKHSQDAIYSPLTIPSFICVDL